jgi:hypothetical protein
MRAIVPVVVAVATLSAARAQADATTLPSGDEMPRVVPKVVVDGYVSYGQPAVGGTTTLMTTPAVDRTFALNLAAVGVRLEHANLLGELVLQYGSSVDALYPSSPTMRALQLAWVGWRTGDFTAKAGLVPSPLGHESWVSTDNWNYSHAFLSDATPYYVLGAELDWRALPTLGLSALVFNGWNTFTSDTSSASGAIVATWSPSDAITVRDTVFAGRVRRADRTANDTRVIDDLVATWSVARGIDLALEAFAGTDQRKEAAASTYYGGALWAKISPFDGVYLAARGEMIADDDLVLVRGLTTAMPSSDGAWIASGTLTIGVRPHRALLLRVEGQYRASKSPFFVGSDDAGNAQLETSAWNAVASAALAI